MTNAQYIRLKKALMKQRQEVTASPQAAKAFLKQMGVLDILDKHIKKRKGKKTTS